MRDIETRIKYDRCKPLIIQRKDHLVLACSAQSPQTHLKQYPWSDHLVSPKRLLSVWLVLQTSGVHSHRHETNELQNSIHLYIPSSVVASKWFSEIYFWEAFEVVNTAGTAMLHSEASQLKVNVLLCYCSCGIIASLAFIIRGRVSK